jgi:SAM-dependent methyltransferase
VSEGPHSRARHDLPVLGVESRATTLHSTTASAMLVFTPSHATTEDAPSHRGQPQSASVDDELDRRLGASGYDAPGFAERYDRYRPSPPPAILELLQTLVGPPGLVVDLGCGTGLSTRVWGALANRVVGVEPNNAMVTYAGSVTVEPNVEYVCASAYETGLPAGCADIVTASQSLHWMDPVRVFAEIDRLLRPGGVLCAYQYVSLLTPHWEPEEAFGELRQRTGALRKERGLPEAATWSVSRERIEESGVFSHTREIVLHSVEKGDGDRLVGFALSEGSLQTLLAAGVTEDEVGLTRLRTIAATTMEPVVWWLGYRVWLGLK